MPASWNVSFFDDQIGAIVGQGGYIFKTIDGGRSWQKGRTTEIAIEFRDVPHRALFARDASPPHASEALEKNILRIKIQPDEGISLKFLAKIPGAGMRVKSIGNPVVFARRAGVSLFYTAILAGGWSMGTICMKSSADGETWTPARRVYASPLMNVTLSTAARPDLLSNRTKKSAAAPAGPVPSNAIVRSFCS